MKKIILLGICFLFNSLLWAAPELDQSWGKITQSCQTVPSPKHVWLFKQWHLGPKTNTFLDQDFAKLPQEKNQTAIYLQIAKWIENKQMEYVFAEGCQDNELNEKSSLTINGWNISSLQKLKDSNNYSQIVSSVPLKLEAKFTAAVKTLCGDDLALIEKNALAFSDARAGSGFLSRIGQFKKDDKSLTRYLDAAREAYKLPPNASKDAVVKHIVTKLKTAVASIQKYVEARNQILIKKVLAQKASDQVIVFGGMHTPGLIKSLEDSKINCSVVTPVGYQDNETELLSSLKTAVGKL